MPVMCNCPAFNFHVCPMAIAGIVTRGLRADAAFLGDGLFDTLR